MDMRGLNFANRARHRGESVRPDLWPDHAWVPALGCQGGVLYDLCGSQNATLMGAYAWAPGGVVFSSHSGYGYIPNFPKPTNEYGRFSIVSDCALSSQETEVSSIWGSMTDAGSYSGGRAYRVEQYNHSGYTGIYYACYGSADFTSNILTPANGRRVVTGAIFSPQVANTFVGSQISSDFSLGEWRPATDVGAVFFAQTFNGEIVQHTNGTMYALLQYDRSLSQSDIACLSLDSLLPFRRRVPVFYSVPSGGTTFNAAWARNSNVIIQPGVH